MHVARAFSNSFFDYLYPPRCGLCATLCDEAICGECIQEFVPSDVIRHTHDGGPVSLSPTLNDSITISSAPAALEAPCRGNCPSRQGWLRPLRTDSDPLDAPLHAWIQPDRADVPWVAGGGARSSSPHPPHPAAGPTDPGR